MPAAEPDRGPLDPQRVEARPSTAVRGEESAALILLNVRRPDAIPDRRGILSTRAGVVCHVRGGQPSRQVAGLEA